MSAHRDPRVLSGMALPAPPPPLVEVGRFRELAGLSPLHMGDEAFRLSPLSPADFRSEVARLNPPAWGQVEAMRRFRDGDGQTLVTDEDIRLACVPLVREILLRWLGNPSSVLTTDTISDASDTDPLMWGSAATRTAALLLSALASPQCSPADARRLCEDTADGVRVNPAVVRQPDGFEDVAQCGLDEACLRHAFTGGALSFLVERAFLRMTWVPSWMAWTGPHARGVALLLLGGGRGLVPAEIVPTCLHARHETLAGRALIEPATDEWTP